jgi:hypothetical protein
MGEGSEKIPRLAQEKRIAGLRNHLLSGWFAPYFCQDKSDNGFLGRHHL